MQKKARYKAWSPYCQQACPLNNHIRDWLQLVKQEKIKEAWQVLASYNPFPAIMGRICYHFCERACRRGKNDASVAISQVERWLGDQALEHNWSLPMDDTCSANVKIQHAKFKVLVIGAGPAGLSAAYQLARRGALVTIWEQGDQVGGELLRTLPSYRLPLEVARKELARVVNYPGIEIVYHHAFKKEEMAECVERYDAVILATGAEVDRKLSLSGMDETDGIATITMSDFLVRVKRNVPLPAFTGKKVVVYGGGNSAIDAARTAKRLGASRAIILYHRSRECMPAFPEELDQALAEGAEFLTLRSIMALNQKERRLQLQVNNLDDDLRPVATGKQEFLEADILVLAVGQQPDLALYPYLTVQGNNLAVDATGRSSQIGIWAIGDLAGGARNAAAAIGSGHLAAQDLCSWLQNIKKTDNHDYLARAWRREIDLELNSDELDWFKKDNADDVGGAVYPERYTQSTNSRVSPEVLAPNLASQSMQEISTTIDEQEARAESERCYSCGSCRGCGNCMASCPKGAVALDEKGYFKWIDPQKCIGCGLCTRKCPCGVLFLSI